MIIILIKIKNTHTHFFQIVGDVIDTKVGIVGDVFNYALGVLQGAANLVVDTVKAGQNRKSVFIDGRSPCYESRPSIL